MAERMIFFVLNTLDVALDVTLRPSAFTKKLFRTRPGSGRFEIIKTKRL